MRPCSGRQRPANFLARLAVSFFAITAIADGDARAGDNQKQPQPAAPLDLRLPAEPDSITVTGQREYLYESDRRLARLRSELPGLGTDISPQRSLTDTAAESLRKKQENPEQQKFLQRLLERTDGRLK